MFKPLLPKPVNSVEKNVLLTPCLDVPSPIIQTSISVNSQDHSAAKVQLSTTSHLPQLSLNIPTEEQNLYVLNSNCEISELCDISQSNIQILDSNTTNNYFVCSETNHTSNALELTSDSVHEQETREIIQVRTGASSFIDRAPSYEPPTSSVIKVVTGSYSRASASSTTTVRGKKYPEGLKYGSAPKNTTVREQLAAVEAAAAACGGIEQDEPLHEDIVSGRRAVEQSIPAKKPLRMMLCQVSQLNQTILNLI